MKHTPGPWEIVTDSYGRAFIRHPLDAEHREAGYFAQVRDYTASEEKTMANARLIAAAPLMFEALQDAIDWRGLDGDGISDPTLSKLQAALKAATDGNQ